MNEAWVPITPNPGADFRTQVLTLVERLVLAAEENEPPALESVGRSVVTQMLQNSHIRIHRFYMITYCMINSKEPRWKKNLILAKWLAMADETLDRLTKKNSEHFQQFHLDFSLPTNAAYVTFTVFCPLWPQKNLLPSLYGATRRAI